MHKGDEEEIVNRRRDKLSTKKMLKVMDRFHMTASHNVVPWNWSGGLGSTTKPIRSKKLGEVTGLVFIQ